MEVGYNVFWVSELRALPKDLGLQDYSRVRKADLISLIRLHDASGHDPEESENEEKVNSSSNHPRITEEGPQKQFDTEVIGQRRGSFFR